MHNVDNLELASRLFMDFVPFLFALCFHEFAHGYVAKMRGDRTAELAGRLSLNPLVHADMLGTFVLPLLAVFSHFPFFGWAKPVPVESRNLKNPRVDMFWIALAGPLSNLLLAGISTVLMALVFAFGSGGAADAGLHMLRSFIQVNLILAMFNLIPVHPLDGGKVLERFLPYSINRKLEEHQTMLYFGLMMLLMLGGFQFIWTPVAVLSNVLISLAAGFSA